MSDKCEINFRLFLTSTNRNSPKIDTNLLSFDEKNRINMILAENIS